ncbi:NAD(P)-dependent alcohol dehydrogenase [Hyphococcus sp.]|uniref:NAD(P)-dependent alcohol dehydrogenase n=1 Tax=Hyphococcus sp. TaxID=2038636 RepID=UPI0035C6C563
MTEARAAIIHGANARFAIEKITVDDPQPGEILVDIKAVGICHSDLVMISGAFGTQFPAVFGHEGAGIVAAVGKGVVKVKPGDKVLLTFNSCGECSRCKIDDPSYCENFMAMNLACMRGDGSSRLHKDGQKLSDNFFGQSSFASKAIANQRNIIKLGDDDDLVSLAPLGCGIQTGAGAVLRSLKAEPGQSLVVIGGGAVGLSALLGGKIAKCSPIILVEPTESRRELAQQLGAEHVIDPAAGDTAEAVRKILPGGAELVVDTSGFIPAMSSAVNMLSNKGKLGLIGLPADPAGVLPLPIIQWITMGGTVRGIVEGDSDPDVFLPELISHYKRGDLPFDKFVSVYPFENINEAVEDSIKGGAVKVVLTL